jgi:Leucine-rich repeat (LRR) protein
VGQIFVTQTFVQESNFLGNTNILLSKPHKKNNVGNNFSLWVIWIKLINHKMLRILQIFTLLLTSISSVNVLGQNDTTIQEKMFSLRLYRNDDYYINKDKVEYLDYYLNEQSKLPDEIVNLPNLKFLQISSSYYTPRIDSIIEQLKKMPKLIGLDLSSSNIDSLTSNIGDLVNLKYLDLGSYKLKFIPNEIQNLYNLEHLSLRGLYLRNIPIQVCNLKSLKILDLTRNNLLEFPIDVSKLINLRQICLDQNSKLNYYDVFQVLEKLRFLEELSMCGTVDFLPDNIGNLKNLRSLKFNGCEIDTLPNSMGNLKKLEYIDLSSNNITDITQIIDILSLLPSLKTIYLEWNPLKSIPSNIGKLKQIKELLGCSVFEVSAEIGQLENLEILDLNGSEIQSLPKTFSNLKNLKSLNLSDCPSLNLKNVFPVLQKLEKLESLYLENDSLMVVPDEISNLKNLKVLSLARNQLQNLPSQFGHLRELEFLDLQFNQISSFPSNFGQLQKLESLAISNNNLSIIPKSMQELKIRNLWIGGNDRLKSNRLFTGLKFIKTLEYINLEHQEIRKYPKDIDKMANLKTLQLGVLSCCSFMPNEVLDKIITALPETDVVFYGRNDEK